MKTCSNFLRQCRRWLPGLLLFVLVWPTSAAALSFSLDVEFDTGVTGTFATVDITETGDALEFVITLDESLGADADLQTFYFNLLGDVGDLTLEDTNAPNRAYAISQNSPTRGGAGSSFDWEVHFGNGAGRRGNGILQEARFTVRGDEPLTIDMLFESSFASGGSIEIEMAAHVQGTDLTPGADSETIGGMVPEPSAGLLLLTGLVLLPRRHASQKLRSAPH